MIKFCSLFSGSSGNCLFLRSGKTKILIDAGLSASRLVEALRSIGEDPFGISAVLVSHEHSDHIKGVGIMSRKFDIPIYANESTWSAMEVELGKTSSKNRVVFETGCDMEIGDINVNPFSIPHDAADPVGFNFFIGNRKVTTATDIVHINRDLLQRFEKSDLLLLESNHDTEMLKVGPYPWFLKQRILGERGHLSNEMAGKVITYLSDKGTNKFILGHLSKENNFPELAYQTVCNALAEKKITVGLDILLDIASRDRAGRVVEL
jgi:phosphoribosyl 1,2-cyclic phosphodiesterase